MFVSAPDTKPVFDRPRRGAGGVRRLVSGLKCRVMGVTKVMASDPTLPDPVFLPVLAGILVLLVVFKSLRLN